jgi:predicted lysophospholipase L1 biosynthesis ABC-type transport system permease subunit
VTAARYGQATIGGDSTELLMIDPDGTSGPTVLSGRLPRTGSEIALGPKLLEHLHSRVGSTVRLSLANSEFIDERGTQPTKDLDLTIVGTGLTPIFGESELADEATVTTDAIKAAGGLTTPRLMLARIRPGTGAAIKGLRADYTAEMATDVIPARVVNLHRVRSLPLVGAFIAALMGIVLLAYTLAIGVRARTRELGVLRALGMSTGRVGRVLAWQGVIIAALVTIIGLPAGVFLGIAAWRAMAHSLGVADRATMSLALAFLVPITVAIGLAASVLPARRARHENVAALLRVE